MVNAIYHAAMTELETILSPRVVSRSLNAGLKQVGKSPKDVEYRDMEKIFKSHIYKQLQVAMKAEKAKEKISDILERLENVEEVPSGPPPFLERQERSILSLRKAFKLFNIYFDWPEVQKSRALLKLIEEEHDQQKEASQLIANARIQLKKAEEKLNDQLVQQDAAIQSLEEAYEFVKSLEDPKVRRLGRQIGQVKNAQADKQLAPAELERARKLVGDLQKIISEDSEKASSKAGETPVATAKEGKLEGEGVEGLLSDVGNEIYELETLGKDFSNLIVFRPELAQKLDNLKQRLNKGLTPADTSIAKLRQNFNEAQNDLCQKLKTELRDVQKDVLDMGDELDTHQLKQNLQVTLDVLENTLPAEVDVREIHDLYRLLKQRASKLTQVKVQERQSFKVKLKQQGEAIGQLKGLLEKYDPNVDKNKYELFSDKLKNLDEAQKQGELAGEVLDDARQIAEALEEALLKKTLSDSNYQEVYLGALLIQVQAIPILEAIRKQSDKVTSELKKSLKQVKSKKELKQKRIEQLEKLVKEFKANSKLNYKNQLLTLKERTEALDNKGTLELLNDALEQLEADKYPDLEEFERELKNAFGERLAENLEELHELESEREQISETQGEEVKELDVLLKGIRKQLEEEKLAEGIDRCWSLLESLRNKQQRALTSFEPRLDEAIKNFSPVSKLNNDATTSVSRILRHLNGQRETFSKVSAEMRSKLENALDEAEQLLEGLKEELETASAVAGKLMSGNILDNVFGLGTPSKVEKSIEPIPTDLPKAEEHATEVISKNEVLSKLLSSYLGDDGVRDAVIFSPTGEMLGGYTLLEPKELFTTLKKVENDWQALGNELTLGNTKFFTIETPKFAFITSHPKGGYSTAIVLDKPSTLNSILNRMRSDLPTISEVLSGPAFA